MYDEMLKIILEPKQMMYRYDDTSLDHFADKLVDKYPREIIEYYWSKGRFLIPDGNRKRYKEAAKHFKKL